MSKRSIDYDILSSMGKSTLIENVRRKRSDGWEPIGGIGIEVSNTTCGERVTFHQAIVKYEEQK